jgi:hypothetical protein
MDMADAAERSVNRHFDSPHRRRVSRADQSDSKKWADVIARAGVKPD